MVPPVALLASPDLGSSTTGSDRTRRLGSPAESTDQGAFGFAIELVADGLCARSDEPLKLMRGRPRPFGSASVHRTVARTGDPIRADRNFKSLQPKVRFRFDGRTNRRRQRIDFAIQPFNGKRPRQPLLQLAPVDLTEGSGLIAGEIRAERDALVRHLDALDAKAGIVLGSAGVVAAIAAQRVSATYGTGLGISVLAALTALAALIPQRLPVWDVDDLRRYVVAEPVFTTTTMLDSSIDMVRELKLVLELKIDRLRVAALLLGLAVVATAFGTIVA
jgi:hypothetical protein